MTNQLFFRLPLKVLRYSLSRTPNPTSFNCRLQESTGSDIAISRNIVSQQHTSTLHTVSANETLTFQFHTCLREVSCGTKLRGIIFKLNLSGFAGLNPSQTNWKVRP